MTSRRPASWSLRTTESSAFRRRSAASKRNAWTPRGRFGSGRSVFTGRSPEVQDEALRKRRRPAAGAQRTRLVERGEGQPRPRREALQKISRSRPPAREQRRLARGLEEEQCLAVHDARAGGARRLDELGLAGGVRR